MLVVIVWNVDFKGLGVYLASVFTVVGVAFFASWSILSNVTASLVLYFYFPYKIGTYIKIMEGSEPIIGMVMDISLFNMRIRDLHGVEVSYPNNLILQKPVAHSDQLEMLQLASKKEDKPTTWNLFVYK